MEELKAKIRTIPDWPKKGVMFRDITTLIKHPETFNKVINIFYERYKDKNIDIVAGIESRGFIFGSILAHKLNTGLVLLRKPGKLPAATTKQEYELEYGKDALEIHNDSIIPGQIVLLIDDLIATAGSCLAACELIKSLQGKLAECAFLVELTDLKGRERLENKGYKVFSLLQFEGE
ncbi:MAG: adenine phosphoribosyltransferase [Candidatus Woesearchaeota archaeon]